MGYACPVCGVPQRDGEHLAHHLAFTAMIHGDDHEAWLDEHAPEWGTRDPEGLASVVVDHAEETEYAEVFDDTVDRGRPDVDVGGHAGHEHGGNSGHEHGGNVDHEHGRDIGHEHGRDIGHEHGGTRVPTGVDASAEADPEVAAALREARELTREMYDEEGDEEDSGSDTDGDSRSGADGDDPSA